jgi:hypothetical protein
LRKRLAVRILALCVIYCTVFIFLVLIQFSKKGNFTQTIGTAPSVMTVRGRFAADTLPLDSALDSDDSTTEAIAITYGARVFFGGLEFLLNSNDGEGLLLTGKDNSTKAVNPDYFSFTENEAHFILPGGTVLVFRLTNSPRGPEIITSVEPAEDIFSVTIPIEPRRSSLVSDNGQFGILFNGLRYYFNRPGPEFENGRLVLSIENKTIGYRSTGRQPVFNPANYVIAQAHNSVDYESAINRWREQSFDYWAQNAASLRNEYDVTAFCSEALHHGRYRAAVDSISRSFLSDTRRSYMSAVYIGGMTEGFQTIFAAERENTARIMRLIDENSMEILNERHILDYLLARNNTASANSLIEFLRNADPENLKIEHCPGILEIYSGFNHLQMQGENPVEPYTEQILMLVSDNILRDTDQDLVYISINGRKNIEFSLRLGKALLYWAENTENQEWILISRSLILYALNDGGIGSGKLYSMVHPLGFPRAVRPGVENIWAWTVSPSIRASYVGRDINLAVSFPEGMSHYIMFFGVRPFVRLQIHGIDFRSDPQFEIYDSSGWFYHREEQVLILKLRHRLNVENVRIIYTVVVPVVEEPVSEIEE